VCRAVIVRTVIYSKGEKQMYLNLYHSTILHGVTFVKTKVCFGIVS
jgi:hypothetical protein